MTKTRFIAILLTLALLCGSVLAVPGFAADSDGETTSATAEDFPFDQQQVKAWWAAWQEAYDAEEEALAQRFGVDVDDIWRLLSGGIPSFLTEDLVNDILHGQGIDIITPRAKYHFGAPDNPEKPRRTIEMDIYPPETTEMNSLAGIAALNALREQKPELAELTEAFALCSQLRDALWLACQY